MERIIFYMLAIVILGLGLLSVTSQRLLRAAVYLFGMLSAVAGFYFLIGYNFLGAVQLTVYAGGIVVLIIFSILLTHEIDHKMERPGLWRALASGLGCLAAVGMVLYVLNGNLPSRNPGPEMSDLNTVGVQLLSAGEGGYLLPFELISVLLLAVIFGAIVIAKQKIGDVLNHEKTDMP